jgi:hypothetical protein
VYLSYLSVSAYLYFIYLSCLSVSAYLHFIYLSCLLHHNLLEAHYNHFCVILCIVAAERRRCVLVAGRKASNPGRDGGWSCGGRSCGG